MSQIDALNHSTLDHSAHAFDRPSAADTGTPPRQAPRPRLSQQQALELVRLLASSDSFRALTLNHPQQALEQLGLAPEAALRLLEPSAATTCRLADKAVFAELLDAMQAGATAYRMDMSVPTVRIR